MTPPKRLRSEAKHGTVSEYSHYGCRCNRCRAAKRDYMRKYRKGSKGSLGYLHAF